MLTEPLALVISVAIEAPIAYAIVAATKWPGRGPLHAAAAAAVATAVTHPQLWFNAVPWLSDRVGYWPSVAVGEIAVVLVEGALITWMAQLKLQRAMLVSLVANAASFAAGVLGSFA
jgi:hypothetical protein